jgi:hypothetical protein
MKQWIIPDESIVQHDSYYKYGQLASEKYYFARWNYPGR